MVILVHIGLVPQEHEPVAVPAEGERGLRPLAEILHQGRKPGLGVFPGIVIAVELIRAEGAVAVTQGQDRAAQRGTPVGLRRERQVAIVAVRHEAVGEVSRERQLLGELPKDRPQRDALFVGAETARRRAEPNLGRLRRARDNIDHAAHGIRAVERRARSAKHLDAVHGVERQRDVHIVMAGLRVVEALAVEQHQRLPERAAADRDIRLHASGRAGHHVHRGVQAQEVGQPGLERRLAGHRQNVHRAIDLFERDRLDRAGDNHHFVAGGLGRAEAGGQRQRQKTEIASEGRQFVLTFPGNSSHCIGETRAP